MNVMTIEVGACFRHGVEDGEELSHAVDERDFLELAGCYETLVMSADDRVVAGGGECRHIQRAADFEAPAVDATSTAHLARVPGERGQTDERCDLATGQVS